VQLHPSKLVGKLPGASYCTKLAEGRTVVVRELPEAAARLRQEDFEREVSRAIGHARLLQKRKLVRDAFL
jgi:hypothetical protein